MGLTDSVGLAEEDSALKADGDDDGSALAASEGLSAGDLLDDGNDDGAFEIDGNVEGMFVGT